MSSLRNNMVANFAGNAWTALMGFLFVPLYIKFIGIEAYGIIGLFLVIQALFAVMDMGLSATASREIARLSVSPEKSQEMRDLVRTLELIYWCVAILIGVFVIAVAPIIASYWIKPGQLPQKTIIDAIRIMGIAMALQWPVSFYSGGLIGLQKLVLLNGINIIIATFRGFGAVLVLWLISSTISAFFLWQIVVSAINLFLVAYFLWARMPRGNSSPNFRRSTLADVWRFAAGLTGITVLSTILTQVDKIILSSMLPLSLFGYYMLGSLAQTVFIRLIGPVFSAVSPRFTQLVASEDSDGLIRLYHKVSQFVSVLIYPAASIVILFSYQLMLTWTQDRVTAENTYIVVSILASSMIFSCTMYIPYALQLAYGWTKIGLVTNTVSVISLAPVLVIMVGEYGAVGAALTHLLLNCAYFLIIAHFMHLRILPREKWQWYWVDVLLPLMAAVFTAGIFKVLMADNLSQLEVILHILVSSIVTLAITAIVTPVSRDWIYAKVRSHW